MTFCEKGHRVITSYKFIMGLKSNVKMSRAYKVKAFHGTVVESELYWEGFSDGYF